MQTHLLLKGLHVVKNEVDFSAQARLRAAYMHMLSHAGEYELKMMFFHPIVATFRNKRAKEEL